MNIKANTSLDDDFFEMGIVGGAVAVILALLYWFFLGRRGISIPCLFHELLHLYCPGCGGTRATIYLLKGKFLTSLWYHPLVPYTACIYISFMVSQTIKRLTKGRVRGIRFHLWYLWGALIILASNFVIKNVLLVAFHITMK